MVINPFTLRNFETVEKNKKIKTMILTFATSGKKLLCDIAFEKDSDVCRHFWREKRAYGLGKIETVEMTIKSYVKRHIKEIKVKNPTWIENRQAFLEYLQDTSK
jgi:hypothetical protein